MISIDVFHSGTDISRILIQGHATGLVGERLCVSISALSRTLLHVVGVKGLKAQKRYLQYGRFDFAIDRTARTQQAALHTVAGYRMFAATAPEFIEIREHREPSDVQQSSQ